MRTGLKSKDNRGFSLVELIVVIAILALMLGLFLLSSNILNVRAGKQCAKQIKHELDQVRISTMGKNEVIMRLYLGSDGRVYVKETVTAPKIGDKGTQTYDEAEKQIGSKRALVEIKVSGGSGFIALKEGGIRFKFNRATGAFEEIGDVTGDQPGVSAPYYIEEIKVTGGGQEHLLKLKKITGKVEEVY